MIRVEDYLKRLQLPEAKAPSPESLALIHQRHMLCVPFENFDILDGVEIVLDEEKLLDKVVTRRRGGFCYELNTCFAWLLRQLGYEVTMLAARVLIDDERENIPPFDHMTLRVQLDSPWLCDVGFGNSFLVPLPLDSEEENAQLAGFFRIRREAELLRLERYARDKMSFRPLYEFDETPRQLAEYEEACRYHQSSPESSFTRGLKCSMAIPDGRITLEPDRIKITRRGKLEEQKLPDAETWQAACKRHFGIDRGADGVG